MKRFPLQVHVSTLFLLLILIVGGALALVGQRMSVQMMTDVADDLTHRITREVEGEVLRVVEPVETAVQLIAFDGVVRARTLEERLNSVALLSTALNQVPALASVYVGYPNGDFFFIRHLKTDSERARARAPDGAHWVVQSIDRSNTRPRGVYLYLDDNRRVLRREIRADYPTSYNPRERAWYRSATAARGLVLTSPYLFFSDRQVGVTVAYQPPAAPGVVIGADIQLQTLSSLFAEQKVTPRSQLALVDAQGTVFAHEDSVQLAHLNVDAQGRPTLARLENFGVDILAKVGAAVDLSALSVAERWRTQLDTEADQWHVTVEHLPLNLGAPLYLVMAVPDSELMAQARAQTRAAGWVTLLIVVLSVPITWLIARRIAQPIMALAQEAREISRFHFDHPVRLRSWILEVNTLAEAMAKLKTTVQRFLDISGTIAAERHFERLLPRLLDEMVSVVDASSGVLYLYDGAVLKPACARQYDGTPLAANALAAMPKIALARDAYGVLHTDPTLQGPALAKALQQSAVVTQALHPDDLRALRLPDDVHRQLPLEVLAVPLLNRQGELAGAMVLLALEASDVDKVSFIGALSGTVSVTLEAQALIRAQKDLFDAFIRLIANAVDAKSAYTGGHCARVPELTHLLAQAACDESTGPYRHFQLQESGWETLRMAAWLHDCGKVTTPEHVVDKATKLEAIYNRIHEVRMRFELLKSEAETESLQRMLAGEDPQAVQAALAQTWATLDEEFAFVARCNQGGEFLVPEALARLEAIAQRTWRRTLDDRLGLSMEELQRAERRVAPSLPTREPLLADRPEHGIDRQPRDRIPADNRWGFCMAVPELLYNLGELHNLRVARGTLTEEDRYKINEHIVQTEVMLSQLPFPRDLQRVVEIAAGHHERLDGQGYPKGLTAAQLSPEARIMAIADIFEALTAADRPYKSPKRLSEALAIMARMRDEQHIDPDLFEIFIRRGVYRQYAEQYLRPEQCDSVDEAALLAGPDQVATSASV